MKTRDVITNSTFLLKQKPVKNCHLMIHLIWLHASIKYLLRDFVRIYCLCFLYGYFLKIRRKRKSPCLTNKSNKTKKLTNIPNKKKTVNKQPGSLFIENDLGAMNPTYTVLLNTLSINY